MAAPDVRHDAAASRYVAEIDGAVAGYVEYELQDGGITLTHTVVEDAHEGKGVGSALAAAALDAARAGGLRVTPACSFIASYVERHPEYADVVGE